MDYLGETRVILCIDYLRYGSYASRQGQLSLFIPTGTWNDRRCPNKNACSYANRQEQLQAEALRVACHVAPLSDNAVDDGSEWQLKTEPCIADAMWQQSTTTNAEV